MQAVTLSPRSLLASARPSRLSSRKQQSRRRVVLVVAHARDSHAAAAVAGVDAPVNPAGLERHGHAHSGGNCSHAHSGELPGEERFDEGANDEDLGESSAFAAINQDARAATVLQAALRAAFNAVGLYSLSERLAGSVAVTLASVALLLLAGGATVAQRWAAAPATAVAGSAVAGVFLLAGTPQFVEMAEEVAGGRVSIHALTAAAVLGTLALGCGLEGALLLVLFSVSHHVEEALTHRARGDLGALWAAVPRTATVVEVTPGVTSLPIMSTARAVPASSVVVGSHVWVRGGECVPLDGRVTHGIAEMSLEHLTGESLPVSRGPGDAVPAGATAEDGAVVVQTTATAAESTPARIARLTARAQARRPVLQRSLDSWGGRYAAVVLASTAAIAVCGPLLTGVPLWGAGIGVAPRGSLYRALGFLAAAAPCALLMSPLAYAAALAACARRGVLVRGGAVLDALAQCGTVMLDKTGTLTTGKLAVESVTSVGGGTVGRPGPAASDRVALAIAATLERRVTHPVASAVVAAAAAVPGPPLADVVVSQVKVVAGDGIEAVLTVPGGGATKRVRFGRLAYAAEHAPPAAAAALEAAALAGGDDCTALTVLAVLWVEGGLHGVIPPSPGENTASPPDDSPLRLYRLGDVVHPGSPSAIAELHAADWLAWPHKGRATPPVVTMVTGDRLEAAVAVAALVGLPRASVHAGVTPAGKLALVESARQAAIQCQSPRPGVLMVGDGMNDAPALAAADVGVAIATTAGAAAGAAADVVLLQPGGAGARPGIALLPFLLRVAEATRHVVTQNLALAGASIAAGAFPAAVGASPLWAAVALHEGATLAIALNSLRLLGGGHGSWITGVTLPPETGRVVLTAVGAVVAAATAWVAVGPVLVAAAVVTHAAAAPLHAAAIAASLEVGKAAWAGSLAGALHTLAGPDHLAALAPLTLGRTPAQCASLGALWGAGHNAGCVLVGVLLLLLRERLPVSLATWTAASGLLAGCALLAIGALGLREAVAPVTPETATHAAEEAAEARDLASRGLSVGTFGTGVVHGLQPDTLLLLLPAFALGRAGTAAYLASFLVGTIVAMGGYAAFLGAGAESLGRRDPRSLRRVSAAAAGIAAALGAALIASALLGVPLPSLISLGGGGH